MEKKKIPFTAAVAVTGADVTKAASVCSKSFFSCLSDFLYNQYYNVIMSNMTWA